MEAERFMVGTIAFSLTPALSQREREKKAGRISAREMPLTPGPLPQRGEGKEVIGYRTWAATRVLSPSCIARW